MTTPLRNPSLAPVYAAVIAFAVVLSLGQAFPTNPDGGQGQPTGATVQPRVHVIVGTGQRNPIDLTMLPVGIKADDAGWEPATLDRDGWLTAGEGKTVIDRNVCISPPAGWTVQEKIQQVDAGQPTADGQRAPSICTVETVKSADDKRTVLTLVHPVVQVETDGDLQPGQLDDIPVLVDGVQDGTLDRDGRHIRTEAVGGKRVCVKPPQGWDVVGVRLFDLDRVAPTDGPCVNDLQGPVSSPKIVFTLRKVIP